MFVFDWLTADRVNFAIGVRYLRREVEHRTHGHLQTWICGLHFLLSFDMLRNWFFEIGRGTVQLILETLENPCCRQQFFKGGVIKGKSPVRTSARFRGHWRRDLSQRGI